MSPATLNGKALKKGSGISTLSASMTNVGTFLFVIYASSLITEFHRNPDTRTKDILPSDMPIYIYIYIYQNYYLLYLRTIMSTKKISRASQEVNR